MRIGTTFGRMPVISKGLSAGAVRPAVHKKLRHGTWTEIGPLLRLLLYLNQQRRPGRGLPRQGGAAAPDRVAAAEGIREIFPFKNEGLEIVYTFSRLSNNFS